MWGSLIGGEGRGSQEQPSGRKTSPEPQVQVKETPGGKKTRQWEAGTRGGKPRRTNGRLSKGKQNSLRGERKNGPSLDEAETCGDTGSDSTMECKKNSTGALVGKTG